MDFDFIKLESTIKSKKVRHFGRQRLDFRRLKWRCPKNKQYWQPSDKYAPFFEIKVESGYLTIKVNILAILSPLHTLKGANLEVKVDYLSLKIYIFLLYFHIFT